MKCTQRLHALGQSLWLDNMTRGLLTSGTLAGYIRHLSVTGLTSNPTIYDKAIRGTSFYDRVIQQQGSAGKTAEALFYELALDDLTQAADLFRPVHDATQGVDGWVSLELSPLLVDDTAGSVSAALELYARAQRPNLLIKIPGTAAGIRAVEEVVFAGVPVNVTLLFSHEHYLAAAEAYLRAIERRMAVGRDVRVGSVASLFVSRWDVAVDGKVPARLRMRLGIASAMRTYAAYCELLASSRWQRLRDAGAQPQRLLWASTGTKDPDAPDTFYVDALAAPNTINTLPEATLNAFADHGHVGDVLAADGGDAAATLAEFAREGIDHAALAAQLQREGAQAFSGSWKNLLACITKKSGKLVESAGQPR